MPTVEGEIKRIKERLIEPKKDAKKKFDPFTLYTMAIQEDGNLYPTWVSTTKNGREVGDEVNLQVYGRPWINEQTGRKGVEYREITEQQ